LFRAAGDAIFVTDQAVKRDRSMGRCGCAQPLRPFFSVHCVRFFRPAFPEAGHRLQPTAALATDPTLAAVASLVSSWRHRFPRRSSTVRRWRWSRAARGGSRLNPQVYFVREPANAPRTDLDALGKVARVFQSLEMHPTIGDPLETPEIVVIQETQSRRCQRRPGRFSA
jgi:hypothetical protein